MIFKIFLVCFQIPPAVPDPAVDRRGFVAVPHDAAVRHAADGRSPDGIRLCYTHLLHLPGIK